jgi:hypothetical protein
VQRSAPCPAVLLQCASATPSLCCVLVFSSLFSVQFCFVFAGGRGQSAQGAMLVYSRDGWGNTEWHLVLTCWSAECMESGSSHCLLLCPSCHLQENSGFTGWLPP